MKEQVRKGGETDKKIRYEGHILSPKLSDMNITNLQSSIWQKIANLPEEKFENYIQASKEITTSGAVRKEKKLEGELKLN